MKSKTNQKPLNQKEKTMSSDIIIGAAASDKKEKQPTINREIRSSMGATYELIDPAKIRPIEYKVLVLIKTVDDITQGGIIKPDATIEREIMSCSKGIIVQIGAEAFTTPANGGDYVADKPQIGDQVLMAKYAGLVYRDKDYNFYRFTNDKDIISIEDK